MILLFQRFLARRYFCWAIAILVLIGVADYFSLKTPPKDIYLTSATKGEENTVRFLGMYGKQLWVEHQDGTRGWVEMDQFLTTDKTEELKENKLTRTDRGYYFTSAEALEQNCIGRTFEEIDGHYRMATEIVKKEDGRMEASYPLIAALKTDGSFYQTQLSFNKEGVCDQVTFGKIIKDRNSFLLKHLPGVQTIMSWDWLTWHVQESLYSPDIEFFHESHAWYTYALMVIGYAIAVTLWAMAPPFLPVLLLLSCFMLSLPRFLRIILKILSPILLIASAYVWMVGMLSWGYLWLIGLPMGCYVIFVGFGPIISFFEDDGSKTYWRKSDEEVLELIKPILIDQLAVEDWEVVPQSRLGDDLGCDEMDMLEIIEAIQEKMGVCLPYHNSALNRIKTIGDLVHAIKKYS